MLSRPGGDSSLTFGILPPSADTKKMTGEQETNVSTEVTTKEMVATDGSVIHSSTHPTTVSHEKDSTEKLQSANAFVSGSSMNAGCVMTGRPTSRVLAPPGGHTSIKLG